MSEPQKDAAAFNPAAQVLHVLEALRDAEKMGSNSRQLDVPSRKTLVPAFAWRYALGLPPTSSLRTLLPAIAGFGELVEDTATLMKAETLLFQELELGPTFEKIRAKVDEDLESPMGVGTRAKDKRTDITHPLTYPVPLDKVLTDADWRSLKICDQLMRRGIGAPLTRTELDGLAIIVAAVREDAATEADLDDDLRRFVVDSLSSIEAKLSDVPAEGVEPLRVVVEHVIATTALSPELREKMQRTSVGRRFGRVLAAIGLAITTGAAEAAAQGLLESPVVAEIAKILAGG